MHRALETPEIITLILRYAKTPYGSTVNPTLAAVARTCRILSDIALDLLWERQKGLVNFIRCMPEDAWVLEPISKGEDGYFADDKPISEGEDGYFADDKPRALLNLTRDIIPGDWSRFNFYAPRTKYIDLDNHGTRLGVVLPAATLTVLALSCPVNPLFPSLQNIYAEDVLKTHINFLPKLVSSALRRLTLYNFDPLDTWHCISIVVYVAQRSPDLEELYLWTEMETDIVLLQESLRMFSKLRQVDLSLPPGSDICSIFRSVTSSPSISTLGIRFSEERAPIIRSDVLKDLVAGQYFTSTENMDFQRISSVSDLSPLLPIFSSSPLNDVHLQFNCDPTDEVRQLLVDIGGHINHATLRSLKVYFRFRTGTRHPYPTLSLAAFIPLQAFHKMQEFVFNAHVDLDLDDEGLMHVVKFWPKLRILRLPNIHIQHPGHVPRLTLYVLSSLAICCPMLEEISASLDATAVTALDSSRPAAGITFPSLARLYLNSSPIQSPLAVALFLSDLCAQGCRIRMHGPFLAASRYEARWAEVQKLLEALCLARRQERSWNGALPVSSTYQGFQHHDA